MSLGYVLYNDLYSSVRGFYVRDKDLVLPRTTAPVFQPPPAPQTRGKLTTWTPDDVGEAMAQRQAQYIIDSRSSAWPQRGGAPIAPYAQSSGGDTAFLVIALGAAAVGLVALLSRR